MGIMICLDRTGVRSLGVFGLVNASTKPLGTGEMRHALSPDFILIMFFVVPFLALLFLTLYVFSPYLISTYLIVFQRDDIETWCSFLVTKGSLKVDIFGKY